VLSAETDTPARRRSEAERERQTDSQTETEIGQNSDVGRGLEYKGDEISSLGVISAAMTWPWPWTHILYYNYIQPFTSIEIVYLKMLMPATC